MAYPLYEYAYAPLNDVRLKSLADLAQAETWCYKKTASESNFPILFNYLQNTFARAQEQNKIAEAVQAACFNTGLVTANFEQIYAYFVPFKAVSGKEQKWKLQDFLKESAHQLFVFDELPRMATYFDNPADLLYDPRVELRPNYDHMINMDENRSRFPDVFASADQTHTLRMALEGAIAHAKLRVERNYKTAIPNFYKGSLQLLLPLCLLKEDEANLALAVHKSGTVYRASTCLTLDMAYNNARLIARPDNEWLIP